MPNWCYKNYVIEGRESEIADLYQKLASIGFDTSPNAADYQIKLTDIVDLFRGDYRQFDCQGSLSNLVLKSETSISFETETAWVEDESLWIWINSKYKTLKHYFSAEEWATNYYKHHSESRGTFRLKRSNHIS